MDYQRRLDSLQKTVLCPDACVIIDHPIDLFYLTGLELSSGTLLVSSKMACLFVDGRYFERCRQQSIYDVELIQDNFLQKYILTHKIGELVFDAGTASYQSYVKLKSIAEELQSEKHSLSIQPRNALVMNLRMIKDPKEIDCLRKAARLGYQGFEHIVSLLREGITESELAFELDFFWRKKGGSRLGFDPIIAFGANASMPHHRAGATLLAPNSMVLIDIGVVLSHYHSDMTRVVYFGDPSPEIQNIYSIVEEAKKKAMAICRPGTPIAAIDKTARDYIVAKGYGPSFTHNTGHGIGLEIHEPPFLRQKGIPENFLLEQGMAITIEPGIYLPGIGGIRLEDTIIITENGYENITAQ